MANLNFERYFWRSDFLKLKRTFQKGLKNTKKGLSNKVYQIKRFTAYSIISRTNINISEIKSTIIKCSKNKI